MRRFNTPERVVWEIIGHAKGEPTPFGIDSPIVSGASSVSGTQASRSGSRGESQWLRVPAS